MLAGIPDALHNIQNQWWRLNNLYKIVTEEGKVLDFKLRPIQAHFLQNMWYRNLVLKSRQHGFTTVIDIWMLDCALFIPNLECKIIAQTDNDVKGIFESKVDFVYDNLPPTLKAMFPTERGNMKEIKFAHNQSKVTVTQSGRGGTSHILHISEFGKISREDPKKAKEIRTGAFESAHANKGAYTIVESTAEGREGDFYDLTQDAMAQHREGRALVPEDFKFHFYPWYDKPDNIVAPEDVEKVIVPSRLVNYFETIKNRWGIDLSPQQVAWYTTKERVQQGEMKREHPSHPDEAFEQAADGSYFSYQMARAREEGRIGNVPYQDGYLVDTFWDLGLNDEMAIWFGQRIGQMQNMIYYFEATDYGLDWYINQLFEIRDKFGWRFGKHWAPHDIENRELTNSVTRWKFAKDLGVHFEVVARSENKQAAIQASRRQFAQTHFDAAGCEKGIEHLDNYRKQWDSVRGVWRDQPLHNRASNGADAFQTYALSVERTHLELATGRGRPDPRSQVNPHVAPSGSTMIDSIADIAASQVARVDPRRNPGNRRKIF